MGCFTQGWFVRNVYARHNRSGAVRAALAEALKTLEDGGVGADLGCGGSRLHSRMIGVDLESSPAAGCRADLAALPFRDGALRVVVSQEVFEHLPDPWAALREVERTLAPGGALYLQVPFIIGRHSGPEDYWRFSSAGLRRLIEQSGLEVISVERSVGAGTAAYRIVVELTAAVAGSCLRPLYRPAKGAAALLFVPLRWLDHLEPPAGESDRIPGGFYALARKPA